MPGLKLRGNDIAASLVNAALEQLTEWRSERRRQFHLYDQCLSPLTPLVDPLRRQGDDSCLMYVIKVPAASRKRVRAQLAQAGIATSVHYPSLAWHPFLGAHAPGAGCDSEDERLVTLPTFLGLSAENIARIAGELERAVRQESIHAAEGSGAWDTAEGTAQRETPTR
jgi:dTDP-4-amino-4,6-dideoxygalactose transaminase